MATEKQITEQWGKTHHIKKTQGTDVDLRHLNKGESIAYGDGETFHWLLTEKVKNEVCTHEFISREYVSQPYGTCLSCGKTILNP